MSMISNSARIDPRVLINFLYVDCARNFAIHHSLVDYHFNIKNFSSDFWRVTSNSTRDYGIIQWYKLFGNSKDKTHWSHQSYISDFEEQVLNPLDIKKQEWENLHKKIKEYRDKNAAHLDPSDWYRLIPEISRAKEVLFQGFKQFLIYGGGSVLDLEIEYKKIIEDTNLYVAIAHTHALAPTDISNRGYFS